MCVAWHLGNSKHPGSLQRITEDVAKWKVDVFIAFLHAM